MSLFCRLLGHKWGKVRTKKETHSLPLSEGEGWKVVTVERDYQHCPRCGDERLCGLRRP